MLAKFTIRIGSAAAISALAVAPLLAMELINRSQYNEDFPAFLFGLMWVLAFTLVAAMWAIVRRLRSGVKGVWDGVRLLVLVAVVGLVGVELMSIVTDQWPCFVGVRLCD